MFQGCKDHDLANLLKATVKELSPGLTSIFAAFHGCLSKHSMHKKRVFEELEEMIGLDVKKVPKFIDVPFSSYLQMLPMARVTRQGPVPVLQGHEGEDHEGGLRC